MPETLRARRSTGCASRVQVAPEDCTGCGLCIEVCPAKDRLKPRRKALSPEPLAGHREAEREAFAFFETIESAPLTALPIDKRTAALRLPLFEFSGACAGCGETPYLRLLTQLFGDHLLIANATGCSSIYGGNLPTTPYAVDRARARPGLVQLAVRGQRGVRPRHAPRGRRPRGARPRAGDRLCGPAARPRWSRASCLRRATTRGSRPSACGWPSWRRSSSAIARPRPGRSPRRLTTWSRAACGSSAATAGPTTSATAASTTCSPRGRKVNVLVLDTEVYSNTGGQQSKATPLGAAAKFATAGKATRKKDLGPARDELRPRLRRRGRAAGAQRPDRGGVPRGRASPGALAHHRAQPVHRPRLRSGALAGPAEARDRQRRCGRSTASILGGSTAARRRSSSTRAQPRLDVATYMENEARFRMVRAPLARAIRRCSLDGGARRGPASGASLYEQLARIHLPRRSTSWLISSTTLARADPAEPARGRSQPAVEGPGGRRGRGRPPAPARSSCTRCSRSSSSPSRWRRTASSTRGPTSDAEAQELPPGHRRLLGRLRSRISSSSSDCGGGSTSRSWPR